MNIRVREFCHQGDGDYEMISRWFGDWEREAPPKHVLPGVGFIVDECVAGFLYSTDSSVCFLDCFISDPNITKTERDVALDQLCTVLLDAASGLKNSVVVANSMYRSLGARALKHGLKFIGEHAVFSKEL